MNTQSIKKHVNWCVSELLVKTNINTQKFTSDEINELEQLKDAISNFIETARENQTSRFSENKKQLGEIYTTRLSKTEQTSILFSMFDMYVSEKNDSIHYDTIRLEDFFNIHTIDFIRENNVRETADVSLYIMERPFKFNNPLNTHLTATSLKNTYCEEHILVEKNEQSVFLRHIANPYIEKSFDNDGDFFFDNPLMFKAKDYLGLLSYYYIVGANYKIRNN